VEHTIFTLGYPAELRDCQWLEFKPCGYCYDEILWKGEFHFQTQIDHQQNQEDICWFSPTKEKFLQEDRDGNACLPGDCVLKMVPSLKGPFY
jgi:hypothetical protein